MTFDIPNEYESVLSDLVASGAFPSTESALRHALELLAVQQDADAKLTSLLPTQTMPSQIDIEDLAKQRNATTFDAERLPPEDVWPSDEPVDDFIAFLNESRKDAPKLGASR